ncbi:MAG: hypothetical protein KKF68_00590 [Nanoarchaeota archaeon]|nr:hypothetical protein [Nanoarchaeota archaeon]
MDVKLIIGQYERLDQPERNPMQPLKGVFAVPTTELPGYIDMLIEESYGPIRMGSMENVYVAKDIDGLGKVLTNTIGLRDHNVSLEQSVVAMHTTTKEGWGRPAGLYSTEPMPKEDLLKLAKILYSE